MVAHPIAARLDKDCDGQIAVLGTPVKRRVTADAVPPHTRVLIHLPDAQGRQLLLVAVPGFSFRPGWISDCDGVRQRSDHAERRVRNDQRIASGRLERAAPPNRGRLRLRNGRSEAIRRHVKVDAVRVKTADGQSTPSAAFSRLVRRPWCGRVNQLTASLLEEPGGAGHLGYCPPCGRPLSCPMGATRETVQA